MAEVTLSFLPQKEEFATRLHAGRDLHAQWVLLQRVLVMVDQLGAWVPSIRVTTHGYTSLGASQEHSPRANGKCVAYRERKWARPKRVFR